VKVTNDKVEDRQAFLTIEIEPDEVEESMESAYKRLVQKAKIPGFRKGKAPRVILERYMGKESVFEEALDKLIPQTYSKALEEQKIEAISDPKIEITQKEPLIYKAVVPLKPEVKLGDYQSVRVKQEAAKVTDSDVDEMIEQIRRQRATWEPVERPVDYRDLVSLDIESSVEDEPLINQKGAQYQVISDVPLPAPGFAEQVVGMKKSENKEFDIKLPPDYPKPELSEKEAHFKIKVTEIKQENLPELNDEFAKEINADFQTLKALKERVTADMKQSAEERVKQDFEEKLLEAVTDTSDVEFPPVMVEAEINRILSQRFQGGKQELEQYLMNVNKTPEELHDELYPMASSRVARSLVLSKIIEEEKIEVSDSEIDDEIENMIKADAQEKDKIKQALNTPQVRSSIEQTLIGRKVMAFLTEIAKSPKKNKRVKKEETNE
jgi:trigger factor